MLSASQITQLKAALDERERVLRGEVRRAIHEKFGRDMPELESMGDDSASSVADLLEDIDTGMIIRDVNELQAIETTRTSIKAGSYGSCVLCHRPVGFKRLIALPTAERCLSCQERHERKQGPRPEMKL